MDFYGVSSSRLQGGLPTDRLVAEWHLSSQHVRGVVEGRARPELAIEERVMIEERIMVPAAIYEWKASERERDRALAVQLENRSKFQRGFSEGLAVIGFSRDADGNGVFELGQASELELN